MNDHFLPSHIHSGGNIYLCIVRNNKIAECAMSFVSLFCVPLLEDRRSTLGLIPYTTTNTQALTLSTTTSIDSHRLLQSSCI